MKLIRVGHRWVNLEYLISGEEHDDAKAESVPIGGLRLTLETGKEFDLDGSDADKCRRHLESLCLPDPGEDLVAHDEGPEEGEEAPSRSRKRKKS
jgi:hypothetical protein